MARHPRAPHNETSVSNDSSHSPDVNGQNISASVSNGAHVQAFTELAARPVQGKFAVNGPVLTPFATVQVVGGGGTVRVDGTNFGNPQARGGAGATGYGRASEYYGPTATVFYGPTVNTDNGGGNSNWISFSNHAAVVYGNGGFLNGGMAVGGTDTNGNVAAASLDAFGGATIYNATAGNGGFLDAGGASVGGRDLTTGDSLISGARVLSGGFGLAGGNKGLTITKNGTAGIASGTGTLANVLVDAGGMVDANSNGLISGGRIVGYGLVESGGTLTDILFNGASGNGFNGLNGYIDVGGTFSNNKVGSGALVSVGGGTAIGNIVQSGGALEVGANYAHHIAQGPDGGQIIITGSTPDEFGSGTSKDTIVSSGGKIIVDSGGVDSDAHVMSSGVISVTSLGTDVGAVVSAGGTMLVGDGAYASRAEIYGTMTNIGGIASDTIIGKGGTEIVGQSALDSGATVSNGGLIQVDNGGESDDALVKQGGTMVVKSGGTVYGAKIAPGMDQWKFDTGLVDPSSDGAIISSGATFAGGTLLGASSSLPTGSEAPPTQLGGLIRVQKGAVVSDLTMGWYGQIEVDDVDYNAGETLSYYQNGSEGTIVLLSNGQDTWSATLAGNYQSNGFQIWDDHGHPVIVYNKCFLRETRISTPRGEIEVQNLQKGDTVWAIVDGKEIAREITAVRYENSRIDKALPVDLAGWSVCIKAGALGDNLPVRDLRVTSEHCFYFDGRFIPVRMLVNGFSIYYDTSLEHFEFFHIETDPHSILRAEGVLTESWLNTEERREAINLSNGITRLERMPSRTWEKDAAAPLDVSHAFAENLWKNLKQRALSLGMAVQKKYLPQFQNDPDLHIRLDDGNLLKVRNRRGNQYFFQIPAGKSAVALVSKRFRPSESIGPWIDDRRQLGVLVGKITVAGNHFHTIEAHHHAANMQGWDVIEDSPCRWTKGEAELPSLGKEQEITFGVSLIVEILAGGPYPEQAGPKAYIYNQNLEKEA